MFFKNNRSFLALLLIIAVAGSVCRISTCQAVSEKIKEVNEKGIGTVQLAVVNADGEIGMSPVSCYSTTMKGHVYGDGVRLRKAASLTSTVLELMNKGEVVSIDLDRSKLDKGFYYVKRIKTGTKGYASTKYVSYL